MRIVGPSARSQNTTRRIRPLVECPIRIKRSSLELCSGSKNSTDSESAQMVWASSNQTPCFLKLDRFLFSSHSNRIVRIVCYSIYCSQSQTESRTEIAGSDCRRTVPESRSGKLRPRCVYPEWLVALSYITGRRWNPHPSFRFARFTFLIEYLRPEKFMRHSISALRNQRIRPLATNIHNLKCGKNVKNKSPIEQERMVFLQRHATFVQGS